MRSRSVELVIRVSFWTLSVLSLAATTAAQNLPRLQPTIASLKAGWERFQGNVPLAGGKLVGVMSVSGSRVDVGTLTVFLPSSRESMLCLELSSQDGRYSARLEYRLTGTRTGAVSLDVPTQYRRELARYEPRRLAILASLNSSCTEAPKAYLAAQWNEAPTASAVVVFLNSRVPSRIRGGVDGKLAFDCVPVDGVTTAYDLACEIPWSALTGAPSFVVEMRRGGAVTRLALPVRLP